MKEWFKCAGIRAIKTVAQTAVATIGTAVALGDVNWVMVASAAALAVNRFKSLYKMLVEWDEGKLKFSPPCPRSTYNIQLNAMADYLEALEARAVMEDIELKEV